MEVKYYICMHCGNIITKVKDSGVPVVCCGEPMKELIPGTTDAAVEKHVPVYEVKGNQVVVQVGAAAHPMTAEHYIQWVSVVTGNGVQRKEFTPSDEPKMVFSLCEGEKVEAVYAYCNLHGLWKAD